jgi:holin-like protein
LVKSVTPGVIVCILFWLLGEAIVRSLGGSYGGGLVGFALLFGALKLRVVPMGRVREGSGLLITHLAFPIVGVTAGVVYAWRAFATEGVAIVVATLVATLFTLCFVGLAVASRLRGQEDSRE